MDGRNLPAEGLGKSEDERTNEPVRRPVPFDPHFGPASPYRGRGENDFDDRLWDAPSAEEAA